MSAKFWQVSTGVRQVADRCRQVSKGTFDTLEALLKRKLKENPAGERSIHAVEGRMGPAALWTLPLPLRAPFPGPTWPGPVLWPALAVPIPCPCL